MDVIRGHRLALVLTLGVLVVLILSTQISCANEGASPLKRARDDIEDSSSEAEQSGLTDKRVQLPRVLDFKEYVLKFNKVYPTTEWMAKANLFLARVINIFRHNAKFLQQVYGYFLGLNAFTDISAKDFEAMGSKGDPALEAVHDTKFYPLEMPASELPAVQQLTGSMGFSMSAANDQDPKAFYEARYGGDNVPKKETLVDFSVETTGNITADFYSEFMSSVKPDEAEQLSKVIDLDKRLDRKEEGMKNDPRSERAMMRRKIKYKPVVESNNANYDGTNLVSQGVRDKVSEGRAFSEKMSAFLNYDVDIMDDLELYESPPPKRTRTKTEPEAEAKSSYFSYFLSTAKELAMSVASTMTLDSFGLDDYDDFDGLDELNDEVAEDIKEKMKQQQKAVSGKIKYTADWRITGCISRPKSQEGCNACYAITVVALMEYYYCRQTRQLTEFSAQYIVDCGKRLKLNGCQGGYLGLVGKFIKYHGLELQSMYPYSGQVGQCPYGLSESDSKKMGYLRPEILSWVYVKSMSDWYERIKQGPLLVGIAMPSDFLAYGGGIHDGLDCNPDKVHAMLLVGSGSQGDKQFWLFKNSFSSDWGESGYFRLSKDAPLKCFNSGIVVRVDFKKGETKNPEHEKPVIANI